MTKNKTTNKAQDPRETYLAPLPPTKGKIYAVDNHPDVNVVAVATGMTPHDMVVEQTKGDMSMNQLVNWLQKVATVEDIILVEAGNGSFELERRLAEINLRCCILESAWVGDQADKYVDNDKIAARRIARVYLQGNAKAVWVPDAKTIELRHLLHRQIKSKQEKTRATNALRGFLTQYNVRPGRRTLSNKNHQEWIKNKREWTKMERYLLEDLIDEVNHTTLRSKKVESLIGMEIAQNSQMLSLMSILGVGNIIAFAIVAVVGDISRFESPKKLAAYIGLNPGRKTSGKNKNVKIGVAHAGRRDLRTLLIQGAHAVLRMGGNNPIAKWGRTLMMRKGNRNVAVAAIGRKMIMLVWHLLKGHKVDLMEPSKSRDIKFRKLLAMIGKEGRNVIELPRNSMASIKLFNDKIAQEKFT